MKLDGCRCLVRPPLLDRLALRVHMFVSRVAHRRGHTQRENHLFDISVVFRSQCPWLCLVFLLTVQITHSRCRRLATAQSGSRSKLPHIMAHEEVFERYERLSQAHGTLCSIAVLVFFPLGAIFLRFARWYPVSLHKWTQLFGCTIYLAGFIAAAILWAHLTGGSEWSLGSHGTLGLVVSICVCLQAVLGLWNHRRYQIPLARLGGSQVSAPSRIMVTAWIHILLGWFIVLAGIANGGLGECF